jgi:hypothetical protein
MSRPKIGSSKSSKSLIAGEGIRALLAQANFSLFYSYRVNVSSMGYTTPFGKKTSFFNPGTSSDLNVLVDTGVTYTVLPPAMVDAIAEQFGAKWDVGEYTVDCAMRDQPGTFDFGFNNDRLIIRVRYFDFILKIQEGRCTFGLQQGTDSDAILGNTFLRGAYGELLRTVCSYSANAGC